MAEKTNTGKMLAAEARKVYESNFGKKIEWVCPAKTKSISLTGKECALRCAHCNKRWLEAMSSQAAIGSGTRSCLISGGCDTNGRVPLVENIGLIKELSKKTRLLAHSGLVSEDEAKKISPFIEYVSFNFVGDDDTIRDVYGLDKTVDDFAKSYAVLRKHVKVFPHITVGLHGGKIRGEYKALGLLKELGADMLVFNVFVPTPCTRYENKKPPKTGEVLRLVSRARLEFPGTVFALGCMRPGGSYRKKLDVQTVGLVNRIVRPADTAIKKAKDLGYKTEKFEECCIL